MEEHNISVIDIIGPMIKEFRLLKDCMDAKFNNVEESYQCLEDRLMDQQTEMKSTLVNSVSNNTQNIQWLLEQNKCW